MHEALLLGGALPGVPSPSRPAPFGLTDAQRSELDRAGFLCITTPLVDASELAELRSLIMPLFRRKAGFSEGAQFNLVIDKGSDAPSSLPQILDPSSFAPRLRSLPLRGKLFDIARQILGPDALLSFEHSILKPARRGLATPWHQDEAYRISRSLRYRQISFWVPLADATVENGCLQYVPGTHAGELLPHRPAGNDPRNHSLECCGGFDPADAVACPVPAGGAVVHVGRALHSAGPNTTDADRYAYILGFEAPPVPIEGAEHLDEEHREAPLSSDQIRRRLWLLRGGALILLVRKIRQGTLKDSRMLASVRKRMMAMLFPRH